MKPCTRTKFGDRCFHFTGPAVWNNLPDELHHITDTDLFKCVSKLYLSQVHIITNFVSAPGILF